MRSKALLIFAHRGEASHFFKVCPYRKPVKEIPGLYESDKHLLLITGNGEKNVKTSLQRILDLQDLKIGEIINMGIAGALDPALNLNEIYEIGYVLKEDPETESFDIGSESTLKCLTADKAISSSAETIHLSKIGDIVDMEAWYIARISLSNEIPVRIIKLISDYPGKHNLDAIADRASIFSRLLYQFYDSFLK